MTQENFATTIQTLTGRRPFHPFTVELVGGRRIEVDHAQALAYRGGSAVFVAPGNVPIIFDYKGVAAIVADTVDSST